MHRKLKTKGSFAIGASAGDNSRNGDDFPADKISGIADL